MAIGPQSVTVSKIVIVITKPKQPENINMPLRPYASSAGLKNTYFNSSISPEYVVHKSKNGRPNEEK
jgi:hypothetical protein